MKKFFPKAYTQHTLKLSEAYPQLRIPAIVALAFALTWILVYDISQISYFAPADKSADFQTSDFYQLVDQSRPIHSFCDEVVMIPIDDLSRPEIATVIHELSTMAPKVIGIDLLWGYPQPETDIYLREILKSMPCPTIIPDTTAYIYNQVDNLIQGDVTLNNAGGKCIRYLAGANSMPFKIAALIDKKTVENIDSADLIRFGHYEFNIIEPDEISDNSDAIRNRAILIGTMTDPSDMHDTPVTATMPGMLIHANSIATILDSKRIRKSSVWFDRLLAIILCVIFVRFNLKAKSRAGGDLIMRIFQLCLLIIIIFVGTTIYLYTGLSINFSFPLLIIVSAALATDVWLGLESLLTCKFK